MLLKIASFALRLVVMIVFMVVWNEKFPHPPKEELAQINLYLSLGITVILVYAITKGFSTLTSVVTLSMIWAGNVKYHEYEDIQRVNLILVVIAMIFVVHLIWYLAEGAYQFVKGEIKR